MMPTPTTATGAALHILHEADLHSPRQSGRRIRAYCPIHGGDHQRSLSIEAPGGEYAGYGYCHSCHAAVFVPEMNPEEAQRRERGQGRDYRAPGMAGAHARRVTSASLLRPVATRAAMSAPPSATPADWQRRELETLIALDGRMRARLEDERARAYLAARHIPLEVAQACGVGYIPADAKLAGHLAKWRDRLIFPLGSPDGRGYAGRSLWGWQPGMDENTHKALLEASQDAPRRWEKTYPAGWLSYAALDGATDAVIVEGPVDALALLTAGLRDAPVLALVGTAGHAEWLPASVGAVALALDGDGPGRDAARKIAQELTEAGVIVRRCAPPVEDGRGKDWAERWRLAEWDGVDPVFDALDALRSGATPPAHVAHDSQPHTYASDSAATATRVAPAMPAPAPVDDAAPWLADPLIAHLLARGFQLAEVSLI